MLRNYFLVAVRNLLKQKVFSVINILGLAVSIAACLLILMYVQYEGSYDNFHRDPDRVYKFTLERIYPEHRTFYSVVPHSYAQAMKTDFPEVENVMMLNGPFGRIAVTYTPASGAPKSFEEEFFMAADSTFFQFFDLEMVKGDKEKVFSRPNNVVITEEVARRYFGAEEALGKHLVTDAGEYNVAGICKSFPANSHLKFDFLASLNTFPGLRRENYIGFDSHIYVKLKPGTDVQALENKFPKMVDTYAAGQIERDLRQSWADYKKAGNGYRYILQPLTQIHLDPTNYEATITPSANGAYIRILGYVALLILVIACINFMNLATARSAERAREVGVRKTMGSPKSHLVYQFLTESVLVAMVAMGLAVGMAHLALPAFNFLAQKEFTPVYNMSFWVLVLGSSVGIGVLAGLYPAFILSGFNPVVVMKGNFGGQSKGAWMRNGLVVFQFMISIILMVGTLVVGQQMKFMQSKNMGFDKSQVVFVERAFAVGDKLETFSKTVRDYPTVTGVGVTTSMLGREGDYFGVQFRPEGTSEVLTVKSMAADDHFAQMIGFKMKEGNFFSETTNDSLSLILNQAAVKALGIKDALGARLVNVADNNDGTQTTRVFTITGIVEDFHFQSLRDQITPLVIYSTEFLNFNQFLAVRLKPSDAPQTLAWLETKWREFAPNQPFRYSYLDERIQNEYAEEKRAGDLFSVFSGLAILIACVGLFGLSAYTTGLRTKEVGVRKVMGASVASVTILLSKDFTKLVTIAFVLAAPFGWWMMTNWLESFAYRVNLGVGAFVLAGVMALGIAWLTVSYQSIKAAMVNPVKSLRRE